MCEERRACHRSDDQCGFGLWTLLLEMELHDLHARHGEELVDF